MVVANDRLSICLPWLVEGGIITKALCTAPDSWEGFLMVGYESQPWWLLDRFELEIGLF